MAQEETLLLVEDLLLDQQGDYRDLFTSKETYVDRRLAAVYNIAAPKREGFGKVTLPAQSGRQGLLGHASFLALYSHPVSSSATLRGKFIREVVLCGKIEPPPAGVDTALPEPSGEAVTLRDRVSEHLVNPTCRECHENMDPIGLGLENYDGIGRHREKDSGAVIDASGDLDGAPFQDALSLSETIHDHPDVPRCFVRNLYRYATAHQETAGEMQLLGLLTERFIESGHRLRPLLMDIIMSPGFRRAGEPSRD